MIEENVIKSISELVVTINEEYEIIENKLYTFNFSFIVEKDDLIRIKSAGIKEEDTK